MPTVLFDEEKQIALAREYNGQESRTKVFPFLVFLVYHVLYDIFSVRKIHILGNLLIQFLERTKVRILVLFQSVLGLAEPGRHDSYEPLGGPLHGSTALHRRSGWRSGKFRQLFPIEESSLLSRV